MPIELIVDDDTDKFYGISFINRAIFNFDCRLIMFNPLSMKYHIMRFFYIKVSLLD